VHLTAHVLKRRRHAMHGQSKKDLRISNHRRRSLSPTKPIYIFRCGETGLYAFTADSKGRILPSRLYPRVQWRLQRRILLRFDRNSPQAKFMLTVFDAIEMHGFHLVHASVDDQLLLNVGQYPASLNGGMQKQRRSRPRRTVAMAQQPGIN
jgi:hypothetical protein